MINPWNFLFNNKQNKNIEFAPLQRDPLANSAGIRPDGTFAQAPSIEAVLLDNNSQSLPNQTIQPEKSVTFGNKVKNKIDRFGQNLYNNLMGQQATPTDDINTINTSNGAINATISENPRTGGFLRDFSGGYQENRFTPASLGNIGQNTLADGRPKGFAYRAGEALGSLARFGESPLGRSLLVGGTIGALGGDPAAMLTFGATTGMLNQGNRMRDRACRDDLITTAQQSLMEQPNFNKLSPEEQETQLKNIANQVNNYHGYMDNNTYNNMMKAQQIRDNANWRKFYYNDQKEERALQREIAQDEREYQHKQDAISNQLQREKLANDRADRIANRDIQYIRLGLERDKILSDLNKPNERLQSLQDIENQLNNFQSTFSTLPGKFESYTTGALRGITGTQTQKEANFNAQRTLLFNQIARTLGGEKGVLSDNDIKRIEAALPTLTDSLEQKNAKMQAVYDLLDIKKGQNPRSQSFKSGKYTVRVKG